MPDLASSFARHGATLVLWFLPLFARCLYHFSASHLHPLIVLGFVGTHNSLLVSALATVVPCSTSISGAAKAAQAHLGLRTHPTTMTDALESGEKLGRFQDVPNHSVNARYREGLSKLPIIKSSRGPTGSLHFSVSLAAFSISRTLTDKAEQSLFLTTFNHTYRRTLKTFGPLLRSGNCTLSHSL